jgi:hypothetical protein
MTVTVSKPALNLREELSALKKPTGIKGEELLRANTVADVYTSLHPVMFRNKIGNGAMLIDQRRNGAAATGVTGGTDIWLADRFRIGGSAMATGRFTFQQVTDAPAGSGLYKSGKITVTAAQASSGSYVQVLSTFVEANNMTDFEWGTSTAKIAVFSFWVKASIPGMYAVALRSDNANASFVSNYNVNTANIWEYKSIVVSGPTIGTWNTGNAAGLRIDFDLGTDNNQYVADNLANTWVASDSFKTASSKSLVATNGATWQITGVQLERGSVATPFEHRPIGIELLLAQRYFQKSYPTATAVASNTNQGYHVFSMGGISSNYYHAAVRWKVSMRDVPSVTVYTPSGTSGSFYNTDTGGTVTLSSLTDVSAEGIGFLYSSATGSNSAQRYALHFTASAEY